MEVSVGAERKKLSPKEFNLLGYLMDNPRHVFSREELLESIWVTVQGKLRSYSITPEALMLLYKNHLAKILARGGRNQALFEAYLQYCFSPKHTVGEQLLDVRRDKRERAAYTAMQERSESGEGEEEDDDNDEEGYRMDIQADIGATEDPDTCSE